eukprot:gnl/TRDRNA2_/TRDRNA2_178776_c0_seq1.p1 gnl/TRDRNA2_/TRDRNA2_178776_c0~~gnl/TRDRNA2_/TRDRNA2_178776_c0_seq1.p1  ORF type:complete len:343 (+),score=77.01 gnl/TRDRNA2_/TRDRNA2_178776_c0_seq1:124-1152(+)
MPMQAEKVEWYYLDAVGKEYGPVDAALMREMWQRGRFPVHGNLRVRLSEWKEHVPVKTIYSDHWSVFVEPPRLGAAATASQGGSKPPVRGGRRPATALQERRRNVQPKLQQQQPDRSEPAAVVEELASARVEEKPSVSAEFLGVVRWIAPDRCRGLIEASDGGGVSVDGAELGGCLVGDEVSFRIGSAAAGPQQAIRLARRSGGDADAADDRKEMMAANSSDAEHVQPCSASMPERSERAAEHVQTEAFSTPLKQPDESWEASHCTLTPGTYVRRILTRRHSLASRGGDVVEDVQRVEPPDSVFWDWPLSRSEKKARVIRIEREMLESQLEELRGQSICFQL